MGQTSEILVAPAVGNSTVDELTERSGTAQDGQAWSIEKCLAEVNTPVGLTRLKAVLAKRPFPHFEAAPGQPDCYLRIDENGTRTVGQFIGREFVAVDKL